MTEENIDARLAEQVANLSTRLVTEVAKLLELEETILQLRKENYSLKSTVSEWKPQMDTAAATKEKLTNLQAEHAKVVELKEQAEAKAKQLEGEVEDLTASLFDEANKRVSNASRETYNFKVKNKKLHEEIDEKNTIIDSLQEQLKDLKDMVMEMEDKERSLRLNTPRLDQEPYNPVDDDYASFLGSVVHGPRARAIRFDLLQYQQEFSAFVFQLIRPGFPFDLPSLKTLRYFKRLWIEEIEPTFPSVPSVSNTFINRFSKGKTFWSLIVEGKAKIEPVSGINETFKLTYGGIKSDDQRPVAMKDPCAFCGEDKSDLLEHARLYTLKLYGPTLETSASVSAPTDEDHQVMATYPLCNFCLVKLRAICELFAKLRLVHSNIYKLTQNRLVDEVNTMSAFQFSKLNERSHHVHSTRRVSPEDESILVKLYVLMLTLRAKIYWSKIGFWDTDEDVTALNLDEVKNHVFKRLVQENVAFRQTAMQPVGRPSLDRTRSLKSITSTKHSMEAMRGSGETQRREGLGSPSQAPPTPNAEGEKHETALKHAESEDQRGGKKTTSETNKGSSEEDQGNSGDDEGFTDTQENFDKPLKRSNLKQFKAKMNKDLNLTMQMLQESLEDNDNDNDNENDNETANENENGTTSKN